MTLFINKYVLVYHLILPLIPDEQIHGDFSFALPRESFGKGHCVLQNKHHGFSDIRANGNHAE